MKIIINPKDFNTPTAEINRKYEKYKYIYDCFDFILNVFYIYIIIYIYIIYIYIYISMGTKCKHTNLKQKCQRMTH